MRKTLALALLLLQAALLAAGNGVTGLGKAFYDFDELKVNGTTGTPLGGFGAGGIKYNANDGTFAAMLKPPADAYDFKPVKGARIEMTVDGRTTVLKGAKTADGRTDDDALWPTHRVNFGCIDGIQATMTAFSPFDNKDYDNMSLPYAFYEISMANSGDRDAKVSLRFVFPEDVKTWAVASDCTGEKTIRKGGTATARFVVAWYDHTDPELAHYKNLYASPQPIAKHGLEVFPQLKHNAVRLANGMRSSSLPHWLQNQVANTLSAIVINSMYKRDGRVAFAEGQWTCFRTNARVLFNCRGIHIPSHFYTHGLDCQFDKTWPMTFWVAGAPWYSMFYWDYYLYTRDREFLRRRALPFMEESVAFFEDFLTEGADGKYIVNPSYSPENHPKNYKMQACINATMDIAAIKALLRAVIEASRTLGANSDRIPAWQAMLDKMPAYGNNADGEFREWLWADMEDNHEHRHASHLIGLYDLHDPEIMQSRELRQGALKAIDRRMDFRRKENTGVMAFGICQLAFSAAALGQADRCEEMLGWLGDNYFLDNMFSTHDPHNIFNCDISGGYPSLVMKMLCYSEPGRIDVFPAKPSSWRRGNIKGMALRGGIIMEELRWDGSKTTVTLRADDTQKVSVTIYGKHMKNVRLKKGKPTTLAL